MPLFQWIIQNLGKVVEASAVIESYGHIQIIAGVEVLLPTTVDIRSRSAINVVASVIHRAESSIHSNSTLNASAISTPNIIIACKSSVHVTAIVYHNASTLIRCQSDTTGNVAVTHIASIKLKCIATMPDVCAIVKQYKKIEEIFVKPNRIDEFINKQKAALNPRNVITREFPGSADIKQTQEMPNRLSALQRNINIINSITNVREFSGIYATKFIYTPEDTTRELRENIDKLEKIDACECHNV